MSDKLHMAGIGRPGNQAVKAAVLALARAHACHPANNMAKTKALSERINALCQDETTSDVIVALCTLILSSIGVPDAFDESLYLTSGRHGH